MSVHEDPEHRRTPVANRGSPHDASIDVERVASGWLSVAAGAEQPQCAFRHMRIASTAGRSQADAQ